MGDFIVTIDENKAIRLLKGFDKSKMLEFVNVVGRDYKKDPKQNDLKELRKWINDYPELWRVVFDTVWLMEDNFIKNMVQDKAAIIGMQKNTDEIRNGFGYASSSIMEQMLIDNVAISWLGVQYDNFQLITRMRSDEKIVLLEFLERRLDAAQRRYLRACETLARVRRLMSGKPAVH